MENDKKISKLKGDLLDIMKGGAATFRIHARETFGKLNSAKDRKILRDILWGNLESQIGFLEMFLAVAR